MRRQHEKICSVGLLYVAPRAIISTMQEQFARTALLLGEGAIEKLNVSRVAVFGLGGVGGYAAEALVRAGVGALDLYDGDVVSITNLNRQIIATHSSLGKFKTTVAAERFKDINPDICLNENNFYVSADNINDIALSGVDYVVDAIDDVPAKVLLAVRCQSIGVKIISSMGTGNKLNPMGFKVADIYKTKVCPLARTMRRALKEAGVTSLKVVYSEEEPTAANYGERETGVYFKRVPGSLSFVPPAAGLLLASEVIKDLIKG